MASPVSQIPRTDNSPRNVVLTVVIVLDYNFVNNITLSVKN